MPRNKVSGKAELRLQLIGPAKDDDLWDEVANYVNGLHLIGRIELLEPLQAEGDVVESDVRLTTSSDPLIRRAAVKMLAQFLEQAGAASHPQMMETIHRLA